MDKIRRYTPAFLVFLFSVISVLAFTGFDRDFFLSDDNATQWYPVIDSIYSEFFEYGKIPGYNFYLEKGLPVSNPGYYAVFNPLMFLVYIIKHIFRISYNGLGIYITILISSGTTFFYLLCRKIKCSYFISVLGSFSFFSCSIYWSFHYWYYIYNNIFIIPLLLLSMVSLKNTKGKYFVPGIILAFEMLLGNVQYTCFHYMFFCIITIVLFLTGEKEYIKVMISNIITGVALSIPFFTLLLRASENFGNKDEFMSNWIETYLICLQGFIPYSLLNKAGINLPFFISTPMARDDANFYYNSPATVIILIALFSVIKLFISKLIRFAKENRYISASELSATVKDFLKIKYNECKKMSFENKFFAALVITLLFGLSYSSAGIIAYIISALPVLGKFRYLFKMCFSIFPIAVLISLKYIKISDRKKQKVLIVLCGVLSLIGYINNFGVYDDTRKLFMGDDSKFEEKKIQALAQVSQSGMKLKDFRCICIYQSDNIYKDKFCFEENLTRNFPAYINTFSLSAYEISASKDRLKQFDKIYNPDKFMTVYANAGSYTYFEDCLEESIDDVEEQLCSNSVRYILIEDLDYAKDIVKSSFKNYDEYGEDIVNRINSISDCSFNQQLEFIKQKFSEMKNIDIESVSRYNDSYSLITLSGIPSICSFEGKENTGIFDDRMDSISFKAYQAGNYTVSLAYDSGINAFSYDDSGNRIMLDITEDKGGNISVEVPEADRTITIGYKNKIYDICFVFEIIISMMFIICLYYLFLRKSEETENRRNI